jgi:predicted molibdopterin-dependent oxidoreductase YjgC
MAEPIRLTINGRLLEVEEGTTVAAALLMAGTAARSSASREPREPFCGMGICMECRTTINGVRQQTSCQRLCEPGMQVVTR